jgi:hypothetical protein
LIEEVIANSSLLSQSERDLFINLKKDYKDIKEELEEQAGIMYNIKYSRLERVLWLYDLIWFPYHISILKDKEIWSSYKLLLKKELDARSDTANDRNSSESWLRPRPY